MKIFLSAFFCIAGIISSYAQQNTTASGGDASGTGGTVSYSVGQIDYTALSGSNGSINQGVQQPYEILIVTGISQNHISLQAIAFPNPVTDVLTLTVKSEKPVSFDVDLTDATGKTILTKKITSEQTLLDLKTYAAGIYFVTVRNESEQLKQFKIIKNK